jgi:hypothetical protein
VGQLVRSLPPGDSLAGKSCRFGGNRCVIGISTDDYRDKAEAFLRHARTTFAHYIDDRLLLENMLGADRLPLTLLVDAQGRILSKTYGARDWDSAETRDAIARAFRIQD